MKTAKVLKLPSRRDELIKLSSVALDYINIMNDPDAPDEIVEDAYVNFAEVLLKHIDERVSATFREKYWKAK